MNNHPAHTYTKGRVAVCGDAAHASSPYHGAGAGFAIEDALVLAELIQKADNLLGAGSGSSGKSMAEIIKAALETYSEVRLERTQWLVEGSRYMGEVYQLQHGRDRERIKEEIDWRSHRIWDYDVGKMVVDATTKLEKRVELIE
jgi:salicylate hydroxylase